MKRFLYLALLAFLLWARPASAALVWSADLDENTGTTVTPSVGSGTCAFGASPTWATGYAGSAVHFDSADVDNLDCSVTPSIDGGNNWTITARIKGEALAAFRGIVSLFDTQSAGAGGVEFYVDNGDKLLACAVVGSNSRECVTTGSTSIDESGAVWSFVAARKSGTTLTVWLNGVQDGTGTLSSATMDWTSDNPQFLIGAIFNGTTQVLGFEGAIDEVRIYDSAEDVAALYGGVRRSRSMPIIFQ